LRILRSNYEYGKWGTGWGAKTGDVETLLAQKSWM